MPSPRRSMRWSSGTPKPRVLPVPVRAWPMTSSPASASGSVSSWMAKVRSIPAVASADTISGATPRSAKVGAPSRDGEFGVGSEASSGVAAAMSSGAGSVTEAGMSVVEVLRGLPFSRLVCARRTGWLDHPGPEGPDVGVGRRRGGRTGRVPARAVSRPAGPGALARPRTERSTMLPPPGRDPRPPGPPRPRVIVRDRPRAAVPSIGRRERPGLRAGPRGRRGRRRSGRGRPRAPRRGGSSTTSPPRRIRSPRESGSPAGPPPGRRTVRRNSGRWRRTSSPIRGSVTGSPSPPAACSARPSPRRRSWSPRPHPPRRSRR